MRGFRRVSITPKTGTESGRERAKDWASPGWAGSRWRAAHQAGRCRLDPTGRSSLTRARLGWRVSARSAQSVSIWWPRLFLAGTAFALSDLPRSIIRMAVRHIFLESFYNIHAELHSTWMFLEEYECRALLTPSFHFFSWRPSFFRSIVLPAYQGL